MTSGTPAALAAKHATRTIPIVMAQLADPVGAGLVASLGRPGGNVTGMTTQDTDLIGKRLELLLEVAPKVSRFALLVDETNPGTVLIASGTQVAARSVGVQLQYLGVRDPSELEHAFFVMKQDQAGALIVESSSMLFMWRTRLADLALKNRLPTIFAQREYAEGGGLHTRRTSRTCSGEPPPSWTKSSRVPSLRTSQWSSRQSSSSSSTSRPRKCSASKCHQRSSRARTR